MFDENKLWKERLGTTSKELGKYFRYIFNGHIVLVLLFLIGTAAFYYQEWVKTLSPDYPVAMIMAVLLAMVLTYSPIYTFFMEADRIFLLPLENKLTSYFRRSMIVSFILQVYILVVGLAVFMPMYAAVNNGNFKVFLPFLIALSLVKLANMLIRWRVQYFVEKNVHTTDSFVRFCVNGVFLYFLFSNANLLFFIPFVIIYIAIYIVYSKQSKKKGLKWEFLIDQEEKRMMSFYRLANLFTDVPKLKNSVKRRRYLDWISEKLPYQHDSVYIHLYVHTFIRGGDFFGLFLRLTIIGAAVLFWITFGYGQILFLVLFLFSTGFQLLPLWNHHQNKIWIVLYPVEESLKRKAFQKILSSILIVQSALLSIPIIAKGEWVTACLAIAAGILFSYLFVYIYSSKKLKN